MANRKINRLKPKGIFDISALQSKKKPEIIVSGKHKLRTSMLLDKKDVNRLITSYHKHRILTTRKLKPKDIFYISALNEKPSVIAEGLIRTIKRELGDSHIMDVIQLHHIRITLFLQRKKEDFVCQKINSTLILFLSPQNLNIQNFGKI